MVTATETKSSAGVLGVGQVRSQGLGVSHKSDKIWKFGEIWGMQGEVSHCDWGVRNEGFCESGVEVAPPLHSDF